jgi:elongator complex protein 1
MYKETLNAPKIGLHGDVTQVAAAENDQQLKSAAVEVSKINRICNAFLEVLKSRTSTNLQNIITAHVCKSPPDLDAGLMLIADLRGEQVELQRQFLG